MAIFAGVMLQRRASSKSKRDTGQQVVGPWWCCGSKRKGRWASIDVWFLRAWEDVVCIG